MLTNFLANIPMYLKQFPSYSNRKCKKSPFSRTAAHIFVFPGDAPATITQYVAWMERQFNACETPRSMYLSIFNSFRVIRCLSQCVSPKIAIFTTFLFPLGTPLEQSRYMLYGWKENSMLTNFLAECAHLTITVSQIERDIGWIVIFSYPLTFDAPIRGVPVGIAPFGMEKLEWLGYSKVKKFWRYVYSFWRDPQTWQTHRQTDTGSPVTAHTVLMHSIAR